MAKSLKWKGKHRAVDGDGVDDEGAETREKKKRRWKTPQIAKVHIIQYTHRFRFIDMVKCEMYSTKYVE